MKGEKAIHPTLKRRGFPRRFFMNLIYPHKADIDTIGENEILIILDFFYQWLNTNVKIIYNSKTKKINNLQLTKGNLIKLLSYGKTLFFLQKQELDYLIDTIHNSDFFIEINESERKIIIKKESTEPLVFFLIPKNGGPE